MIGGLMYIFQFYTTQLMLHYYTEQGIYQSRLFGYIFFFLFFSYLSARNKIIPNNPPDTKATNNFNAFTHTLSRPQLCFCRHCCRSMILLLLCVCCAGFYGRLYQNRFLVKFCVCCIVPSSYEFNTG